MIISHNLNAMMICRNMAYNESMLSKSMQRLSSGRRINSAADDPAGLAISQKMEAQIRGLQMASRNAQDGISVLQTAEGGASEIQSMLQRMRELTVQAANDTYNDSDRKNIQLELDELNKEVDNIAHNTNFNTKPLLSSSSSFILQIGANSGQTFNLKLADITSSGINLSSNVLDVSSNDKAQNTLKALDDAIDKVSSFRSSIGAQQNALEYRIDYLGNAEDNLTAAQSRIMDTDIAKEMATYCKYNILQQVNNALLAQVNKEGDSIIQLLKSL